MSLLSSAHFRKYNAGGLLLLHCLSISAPVFAASGSKARGRSLDPVYKSTLKTKQIAQQGRILPSGFAVTDQGKPGNAIHLKDIQTADSARKGKAFHKPDEKVYGIGGPSQPEMASFKPVGTENMVNLFTGDFSYNIPLLDVGGYPVNIFYNSGITMDQDASWVGLGWNINPGSVSRNMRGVPDDFDGSEKLLQTQVMKPNVTIGANLGADVELVGIKNFLGISLGVNSGLSFNNYLGPAMNVGVKGGLVFSLPVGSEKSPTDSLQLRIGADVNLGSRSGFALSPNASMTAMHNSQGIKLSGGLSVATSYNSRSGIKSLQIADQMSFSTSNNANYKWEERKGGYTTSANFSMLSTSISFTKPSYIPALRMPITNSAFSGHFQIGGAIWGIQGSAEAEVYRQEAEVAEEDQLQEKPLVGYLYYQKARDNLNAVMDFTRLNDREVTATTPIISAPQYSYDVFSIQGEGTGGTIRPYRNDIGYVRDNYTRSKDRNISVGFDVGIPGQIGANFNLIKTPTTIGDWGNGNTLRSLPGFTEAGGLKENVYFRNPGETSVLQDDQYKRIGGTDLVRFRLGGPNNAPIILPELEKFKKDGYTYLPTENPIVNIRTETQPSDRTKRTQVTSFLTASEASEIGLDKKIKSYEIQPIPIDGVLAAETFDRVDEGKGKLAHHISQINVTEADGKRYIYGIPVYNTTQQDFTFSVSAKETESNPDRVQYEPSEASTASLHLTKESNTKRDGYYQKTETPPYAHSYLLSGLLSPDYVDVDGDGITENDLGNAVKFNYTRIKNNGVWADYKWRTPFNLYEANANPGNLSEDKDDKALFSYGERESWYMHSVESKTMIAIFTLEDRKDGKGVSGMNGGINLADQSLKRLKQIDLYSKADVKKNGTTGAKPVKTVHFQYSYRLCPDAPGNSGVAELDVDNNNLNESNGKLTLEKIYFTYNGKTRAKKDQYVFNYGDAGTRNPGYKASSSDRWGTYKPAGKNPGAANDKIRNRDYPYSLQASGNNDPVKNEITNNVAAWSLHKVLLPSGGQLEVEYESDDYAFVQDRRAMDMMEIIGFGHSETTDAPTDFSSQNLYQSYIKPDGTPEIRDNEYVLVKVPDACASSEEVNKKYLEGTSQLAFRLAVWMPKGKLEYITCYADIDGYGILSSTDNNKVWLKLRPVDGYGPLSLTVLEFLREQLPGQAYPGSDMSETTKLSQVGTMLSGMLSALECAFTKPVNCFREDGMAQKVHLTHSFVRLNDPDGVKYGGGHRVKTILMRDNWGKMTVTSANPTGKYTSVYGNQYDYTTTETFNGSVRTISSGVASYEPSIGGEENPFQTIYKTANRLPLGPTSYGAIELPMLDAFFPSPLVGYSKVTVRSLNVNPDEANLKLRSASGKQVHEFYTAKDYPVYYSNTPIDKFTDKQEHRSSTMAFFSKYAFDSRAISQGFLVATNDMHGKPKSQASYPATDPNTPVSYTEYFYKNTGTKGMDEKFDFIYPSRDGTEAAVVPGNMGIDIELMTDAREFSVKGKSLEVQAQVDLFPVVLPVWLPFIWPVVGETESTYRAVTTTKVISYHAVTDKVVAIDKGSQVSTENLVYDAETGNVAVTKTNNEFNAPIYNVTYPAWWAYGGMGLAYKNIDAVYGGASFVDGAVTIPGVSDISKIFESGDELYITNIGGNAGCAPDLGYQVKVKTVWAFDTKKHETSLVTVPDFIFIDSLGNPYNRSGVSFRIVRSGHRNMLSAPLASVTLMDNPLEADPLHTTAAWKKLKAFTGATSVSNPGNKVINASAVEYKEKWQADSDIFGRYTTVANPETCTKSEVLDCQNGHLEKNINPYLKGLVGNFKGYKNWVFYNGRQQENFAISTSTNLPTDGFLKDFTRFWTFQTDPTNTGLKRWARPMDPAGIKWVSSTEATRFNTRGMELETKNALNIYTAAQYGYSKTLPVAITNNSSYKEMFYEGFEDNSYLYSLNNVTTTPTCVNTKHIDFSSSDNTIAQILNTDADNLNFNAHTGKNLLKINTGKTLSKSFNINNNDNLDYSLVFGSEASKALSVVDGNVQYGPPPYQFPTPPGPENPLNSLYFLPPTAYFTQKSSVELNLYFSVLNHPSYNATTTFNFYIEILTAKEYNFHMLLKTEPGRDLSACTQYNNRIDVSILDLEEHPVKNMFLAQDKTSPIDLENTNPESVFLCPGIYQIKGYVSQIYTNTTSSASDGYNGYFWSCTNCDSYDYKFLIPSVTCTYTTPIPSVEAMINPTFSIPANKKMVFSAWVRDNCATNGGGACANTNQANILFNNGGGQNVSINPSGPVIEGWQRYEGAFTVPGNASQMELQLKNNSSQPIYFDDIRIHPYNANMKSYVYDPVNLRLKAELDANNYASFYEYDEEGTLVRTKSETKEGIKTITESRSAKQKEIVNVQ